VWSLEVREYFSLSNLLLIGQSVGLQTNILGVGIGSGKFNLFDILVYFDMIARLVLDKMNLFVYCSGVLMPMEAAKISGWCFEQ
jgi:hypothetical protein